MKAREFPYHGKPVTPAKPALTMELCIHRNLTLDEIRELQQNGGDLVPILRRLLKMQYCKEVWN
jgi:hypothetical protein